MANDNLSKNFKDPFWYLRTDIFLVFKLKMIYGDVTYDIEIKNKSSPPRGGLPLDVIP